MKNRVLLKNGTKTSHLFAVGSSPAPPILLFCCLLERNSFREGAYKDENGKLRKQIDQYGGELERLRKNLDEKDKLFRTEQAKYPAQ